MPVLLFQFGDCSLNVSSRELLRSGQRVNLSPIVFDCIAYLIQHRERAVGRDELVAAVWGKSSISDAVMGRAILTARRAIGDTAEDQRLLRTVPRFGYQWGGPTRAASEWPPASVRVDAVDGEPAASIASPTVRYPADPPAIEAWRRSNLLPWILAAACIVLASVAGAFAWHRSGTVMAPSGDSTSNAATIIDGGDVCVVLPIDVAAAAEDGWMRLGLMDLLATRLRSSGLAVLPSDAVVRLVPTDSARDDAIRRVRDVVPHGRIVAAMATRSGNTWIVRADVLGSDGNVQTVQAENDSPIAAAENAADSILEVMGKRARREPLDAVHLTLADTLQRIDAARLAGDPARARALIAGAPDLLKATPEVQLRIAQIDLRTGSFEAARARLADLASRVPPESDALLHARIESYLCIALARVGEFESGERACDRAIATLETLGQPAELGRVYSDRGIVRKLQQHYDAAAQDNARARVALTLAGDVLQLAKVDGNESLIDMAMGRYGEAVSVQQRIGETFRRFGMNNERVVSLNNQAAAHLALLQPLDALEATDQAVAVLDRVTDASIRQATALQRADALRQTGRLGEARILLDDLLLKTTGDESAVEQAVARALEASMELDAGQPSAALLLARQSLAARPAPTYDDVRAQAWLTDVRSLDRLGRPDEASAAAKAFAAWAPSGNPEVQLTLQLALAERAGVDRQPSADRLYDEALAAATRWAVPAPLADVAQSYGLHLLAEGDLPGASTVIGRLSRHADQDFESALMQARLYKALGNAAATDAAIAQARRLAGERSIPRDLAGPIGTTTPTLERVPSNAAPILR